MKRTSPIVLRVLLALACATSMAAPAMAEVPVVTDSRIKTFVYNPNEVFTITTHYGYQSNVEFGEKETIETVSVGDRVAWQIIPAGRRLFIRAQEENARTNMTVVTNIRAYQFDLMSSSADAVFGSEELVYVVRFYYPKENAGMIPAIYAAPPVAMAPTVQQAPIMPVSTGSMPMAAPAATSAYNYRYTFSGPSNAAPVKIYDDGRSTFFKFRGNTNPKFAVISSQGEELPVTASAVEPGVYRVDAIAPRFSLRSSGAQVIVYNESNGA
ncbi:MAG: hypothetical protein DI582_03495 [Azospirillum brasilense]|nr:MAG: hypothetical protein DI582_03495 [Azospirillum brasilense]